MPHVSPQPAQDFTFSPALPWVGGTGGTITINNETITEQLLILGRVKFHVENDGTEIETYVQKQSDGNLYLFAGNNIIYGLSLQQDGQTIEVTSRGLGSLSITGAELVLAPAVGSLAAYQFETSDSYKNCLICSMTDGTLRALTHNGRLIVAENDESDPDFANFYYWPSPLIENNPVKPDPVGFEFVDTVDVPEGFELDTAEVTYDYIDYTFDDERNIANFKVAIIVESVDVGKNSLGNYIIIAEDSAPQQLEVVNYVPDLVVSPSLPWQGGYGGSLQLNNGNSVTADELIAGKLKFDIFYNDASVETHVAKDANNNLHIYTDGNIPIYDLTIANDGTLVNVAAASSGAFLRAVRLAELVPIVSVFADEECTLKPVGGNTYRTLYVKVAKSFGFGEEVILGNKPNCVYIGTPTSIIPDDPYCIFAYIDWQSAELNSITPGVYACNAADDSYEYNGSWSTEFGQIYV